MVFLDVVHGPVLFKTYVSETGFCVRLQVEPTPRTKSIELVPISGRRE
jgi:hypothetical protein